LYIDALYDKEKNLVRVIERINGTRVYKDYPAEYSFYYPDSKGHYLSIYGEKLQRVQVSNRKAFEKEKRMYSNKRLYESDIKPVSKCLEKHYLNAESPKLNVCFFDIEVDWHKEHGFAPTHDPFNQITAISLYMGWLDRMITLCIKPSTMTTEQAQLVCDKFDNTILCTNEKEMLENFLMLVDDVDVFSGWNSEGFDIPYTVNRIIRVLGRDYTRKLCLWDQYPKEREVEKYGKKSMTYDLIGRVHLDYLELYRKYTYEERHSYSLDAIGEYELNERKVGYEGTLDQLYNNDFETFIKYNRQDTALLHKIDAKLQFMDLANVLAHANTVLLPSTMGAVAVTDQAIINEAHSKGLVIADRVRDSEASQAAGAYVANPKVGLHDWVGSMDLNSLYPSVIRALNMSPETIIGQIRQDKTKAMIEAGLAEGKSFAECWEGKFACLEYEDLMSRDIATDLIIDWENGEAQTLSAAQAYEMFFLRGENIIVTANGTIFDNSRKGIIPGLLERWYAERKILQKKSKTAMDIADGIEIPAELEQEILKLMATL
jgi:DNA polymerase elongation subunit (family B)